MYLYLLEKAQSQINRQKEIKIKPEISEMETKKKYKEAMK
jgi:hypothetical protein